MRAQRGFTMLEVLTVVAIVGIVAALAIPMTRAARRNASVSSATFELALWIDGLRTRAMRDQRDLVAIVLDVPRNDPLPCTLGADALCGAYYLVRPTTATFALNGFNPAAPGVSNAEYVWDRQLPHGIRFHRNATGRVSPPPYAAIRIFDPLLVGACANDRACVGVRFRGDGGVEPVWPNGVPGNTRSGLALALGSELSPEATGSEGPRANPGSHQQAIAITFPTGIVKTYGVAR